MGIRTTKSYTSVVVRRVNVPIIVFDNWGYCPPQQIGRNKTMLYERVKEQMKMHNQFGATIEYMLRLKEGVSALTIFQLLLPCPPTRGMKMKLSRIDGQRNIEEISC